MKVTIWQVKMFLSKLKNINYPSFGVTVAWAWSKGKRFDSAEKVVWHGRSATEVHSKMDKKSPTQ